MQQNAIEIWEKTLELLKQELTGISYDTWIKSNEPLYISGDNFYIKVSSSFYKGILETRYKELIKNALRQVSGKNLDVLFLTDEEAKQETEKNIQKASTYQDDNLNSGLNNKYTFDTFVIGNSNRFAHAASVAVAETPAKAYNPLFLYGGVGLGKTHLMHAIGHYILSQDPTQKILYVSSEKFTNELINAIKDDKNEEFRARYRSIDVLLIDDIQFIAGKERTQEEFFHTFNTLYEANKQIIISSDKPPKDIVPLEDRLKSRFEWGLIGDIQAPDFETRIAILRKKGQIDNIYVPDEITSYIANKIESNIRELEGGLNRVMAYSSLTNRELSLELVDEALKDITSSKSKIITSQLIQEAVAKYFNIKIEDFKTQKRTSDISHPRQIAMFLCRELASLSLPKIGEDFGGRDHTTVIHACNKIAQDIINKPQLKIQIEEIRKNIIGK